MTKPNIVFSAQVAAGAAAALLFSGVAVGDKIHRPARLFKAGEYPDKGVTVTPDDLDKIIARFVAFTSGGGCVPVKVEHMDTPFDPLGQVVALYRQADELYGMLAFSLAADALLAEKQVGGLSIHLAREEGEGAGFSISETSIVVNPRVATAGFLTAAEKIASFRAAGKLTPAMEPAALALLSVPMSVRFSDGREGSTAELVEALLNASPVVQPRGPVVPVVPGVSFGAPSAPSFSPEVAEMAKRYGVPASKVLANMGGRN